MRYAVVDEAVNVAVQEDVDALGLSFYSAGYRYDIPRSMELLKKYGKDNILLLIGGIIPERFKHELRHKGIRFIFGPGDPVEKVIEAINTRG
jgi:methylmalonyl-CoA mutase